MSRASWAGSRIVMHQTSKVQPPPSNLDQSPSDAPKQFSSDIYDLLITTLSTPLPSLLATSRVTKSEFDSILSYSAQVRSRQVTKNSLHD